MEQIRKETKCKKCIRMQSPLNYQISKVLTGALILYQEEEKKMTKIECRLYNMLIADQELPPDVEIKWDGGYYAQMQMSNGVCSEGLQVDGNKYNEKRELCRKISDALFELQELIEKEKREQ